jgi:hypothetical protein
MKIKCFMCERPAKRLTAHQNGNVYVNGQDVVLYCSVRCAANYGLLYGAAEVNEGDWHFCPFANKWEACSPDDCEHCAPQEVSDDN